MAAVSASRAGRSRVPPIARKEQTGRSGRRAWTLGLVIAGALLGALAVSQLVLDRVPFGARGGIDDLRIAVVHCLLAAYLPAAILYLRERTRRTFAELRTGAADERLPLHHGIIAVVVGISVSLFGPFLSGDDATMPWHPSTWTPEVVWHRLLGPVVGVCIAWFAWVLVRASRRLSSAAASLGSADLLDPARFSPFTRQALAHAGLTVGLLAVFGLFVVDQGITPIFVIMTLMTLALALAALLLPLRGVRQEIAAAKARELAWVNDRIRAHVAALHGAPGEAPAGTLADLVAWRKLVEDVREWQLGQSTVVRVALYLLIPLASWLASGLLGALVERSLFGN